MVKGDYHPRVTPRWTQEGFQVESRCSCTVEVKLRSLIHGIDVQLCHSIAYELFYVKDELEFEVIISLRCSSENDVMELYVEFAEVNGSGPSLATIAANVGAKTEAENPTT
ncbi:hypothetical protein PVK06_016636 [Gossypium arboreum]|uniref:Uncharacterized protein n=1 Tax=Gossypium arboreum TaxID=29729 RepID=A0ABR0Q1H0_GOSAR|nr:hypothetical protein PVK06_016636 [Gossypium arboreum]